MVLVFDIFIYFKYSFKILDNKKNTYLHNNENICGLILLKFMQKNCKVILICGFELLIIVVNIYKYGFKFSSCFKLKKNKKNSSTDIH